MMSEENQPLSERELEILTLVATGAANKEIAQSLSISPNTVKVHIHNIFGKIGVASRTEATVYAMRIGLIPAPVTETSPVDDEIVIDAPSANDALEAIPTVQVVEQKGFRRMPTWAFVPLILLLIVLGFSLRPLFFPPNPSVLPVAQASPQETVVSVTRWNSKSSIPEARQGAAAVDYESGIYLIGGESADGIDGKVFYYIAKTDTWQAKASKPHPVSLASASVIGEQIYVAGGVSADGKPTDQFEVYNPREDVWQERAPVPIALRDTSLAALEGRLYLFGGTMPDGKPSANVYVYQPDRDRWIEASPMPNALTGIAAIAINNKILLLGGFDGSRAVAENQAYYPSRDKNLDAQGSTESPYEAFTALPQPLAFTRGIFIGGYVFLFNDTSPAEGGNTAQMMQYNVTTDVWSTPEDLPLSDGESNGYVVVGSNNVLHLLGGTAEGKPSDRHLTFQAVYTISLPIIREQP